MFDIGGPELLVILVLGLLVFGPRRLPKIGKQLGSFVGQMRRSVQEFQGTLEREIALEDIRQAARDVREASREAGDALRKADLPENGQNQPPQSDSRPGAEQPPSSRPPADSAPSGGDGDEPPPGPAASPAG